MHGRTGRRPDRPVEWRRERGPELLLLGDLFRVVVARDLGLLFGVVLGVVFRDIVGRVLGLLWIFGAGDDIVFRRELRLVR